MFLLRLAFAMICFVFLNFSLLAQATTRTIDPDVRQNIPPRKERVAVSASVGLMPTFFMGGEQLAPAFQVNVNYYVNPRLAIGLSYSQASSESEAFVDFNEVQSWMKSEMANYGIRATGSILRAGPLELYGGLQLGIVTTKASYRHAFPVGGQIEDQQQYLLDRPNPFGEPRTQLSPVGFFGASVNVLPYVNLQIEAGNNLSLFSTGLEVRF